MGDVGRCRWQSDPKLLFQNGIMVNCGTLQATPDNIHTQVETTSEQDGVSIKVWKFMYTREVQT